MTRFVVQQFVDGGPIRARWVDVDTVEASDAAAALHAAVIRNETHRIQSTTYRVCEEALTVNVSINLEAVEPPVAETATSRGGRD